MPALKKISPQCFAIKCECEKVSVSLFRTQMQSFSRYSQRIAMRSKRALETMHEIKCRQEQNRANNFAHLCDSNVWAVIAVLPIIPVFLNSMLKTMPRFSTLVLLLRNDTFYGNLQCINYQ